MPCFFSISLGILLNRLCGGVGWEGGGGVGVRYLLLDRCQQPLSLKGWIVNSAGFVHL